MAIFKNTPPIVTNGLVFYVDASSPISYTSGSSTWKNILGSDSITITSTSTSTASFQTNPPAIYVTQSFSAGGVNNLSGPFTFSENLCIELWYKTATTASGYPFQQDSPGIIQIGDYAANASLTVWDWSAGTTGSHNIRTFVNNGTVWSHTVASTTLYTDAQWVNKYHQIILNFSGSAGKWNRYNMFIDGVLQATINFTIPFPSSSIANGNSLYAPAANGGSARNSYSLLRVYSKELNLQEITQNYNATKTRFNLT